VTARRSHAIAARLGRRILDLGTAMVTAGMTALLIVFHVTGEPQAWYLVGPLLVGLGHGLVVAPNIDLVLRSVPPADNGSASGVLNTAQRIGSALGIAVVGTVLFGTLHPAGRGATALAAAFSHSFQAALAVNIGLSIATLVLALVAPRGETEVPSGEGVAR
jgi:MFS-type transporter involved in bile tolerance (Atg22 family)